MLGNNNLAYQKDLKLADAVIFIRWRWLSLVFYLKCLYFTSLRLPMKNEACTLYFKQYYKKQNLRRKEEKRKNNHEHR